MGQDKPCKIPNTWGILRWDDKYLKIFKKKFKWAQILISMLTSIYHMKGKVNAFYFLNLLKRKSHLSRNFLTKKHMDEDH